MNGRTNEEARTLYEGRALKKQAEADRARRLRRAVSDVMDETLPTCRAAAKAHNVSEASVQAAVKQARAEREGKR